MKTDKEDKMKKSQARQGDVLLISTDSIPKNIPATPQDDGRIVLAYGEVTGHAHAFAGSPKVRLFRAGDDALVGYLEITDVPAALRHEEHTEHVFTPGKYKVIQQRQWTLARLVRSVAD